jgi:hypothetical protein
MVRNEACRLCCGLIGSAVRFSPISSGAFASRRSAAGSVLTRQTPSHGRRCRIAIRGEPVRDARIDGPATLVRRDGREAEGARLESVCRGNSTEGSNPSLSANCIASPLFIYTYSRYARGRYSLGPWSAKPPSVSNMPRWRHGLRAVSPQCPHDRGPGRVVGCRVKCRNRGETDQVEVAGVPSEPPVTVRCRVPLSLASAATKRRVQTLARRRAEASSSGCDRPPPRRLAALLPLSTN